MHGSTTTREFIIRFVRLVRMDQWALRVETSRQYWATLFLWSPLILCSSHRHYVNFPSTSTGGWKHLCFTWTNTDGKVEVFFQGDQVSTDLTGIEVGQTIEGNGIFFLGQEMDSHGGSFDSSQAYLGALSGLNVWSVVLRSSVITSMARGCSAFEGDAVSWRHFRESVSGSIAIKEFAVCSYPSKSIIRTFLLRSDQLYVRPTAPVVRGSHTPCRQGFDHFWIDQTKPHIESVSQITQWLYFRLHDPGQKRCLLFGLFLQCRHTCNNGQICREWC